MAAFCPIGAFYINTKSLNPNFPNPKSSYSHRQRTIRPKTPLLAHATSSSTSYNKAQDTSDEAMTVDALKRFIRLNLGNWTGSFHVGIVISSCCCGFEFCFVVDLCLCDFWTSNLILRGSCCIRWTRGYRPDLMVNMI